MPLTEGYSGATLKQLCDDAKRAAIKRTNFTKVAAPTVADMREAIEAERAEKKHGETTMAEIERTRERERPPLADNPYERVMRAARGACSSATRPGRSWCARRSARCYQARQGKLRYYLEPLTHPETPLQMWRVFTHEIRTKSGKHRHQGGLVIYVLEGKGYSIVEGERIDWEKGDLVLLPLHPERGRAPAFQSRSREAGGLVRVHPSADPGIPGVGPAADGKLAGFQGIVCASQRVRSLVTSSCRPTSRASPMRRLPREFDRQFLPSKPVPQRRRTT